MLKNKKNIVKNVIIFSCAFCLYITIEVCFRGYSYPLMGLVAGVCTLILNEINDKISWDIPIQYQMLIGSFIITLGELLSGLYGINILHIKMWDYSDQWGNLFNGLICPLFSFLWGLLSLVAIVLADSITYYVFDELPIPYYRISKNKILFRLPNKNKL